jgi:hypothetical protein
MLCASVPFFFDFRLRVPINAVNLQCDAVQGKVYNILPDLKLLDEREAKSFKRLAHLGLNRSLAGEFAIAGAGAETPSFSVGWHDTKLFVALRALYMHRRPAAFFRAIVAIKSALDIAATVPKRFTTSLARFEYCFAMRALAFKSAEVVAMGCGSLSDRKGTFATDTNLFDAVSAVSAIAGPRAIRAARRPIQPFGRDSHTTAFARRAFLDLRGVGAFSRTVTFGAAIWNRLRVALKRLVATIAYESKRHLMLTAGEEDYQEF